MTSPPFGPRTCVLALTFVAAACGAAACNAPEPATPPPARPPAPVVPATTTASAAPAPPPDDPNAALKAIVCKDRTPCTLVREHDAGKDADSRALSVLLFLVGYPENAPAPDADAADTEAEPPAPPRDGALSLEPDGELFSVSGYGTCFQYEYWRVVREAGHLADANRIAEICNDGHGAAGIGEDDVRVGPNRFTIATSGGSNWRWAETASYSLSPFVRTSESHDGHWSVSTNNTQSYVDWTTLTGRTAWFSPACDPDGQLGDDSGPEDPPYKHVWIPRVALDPTFLADAWKTTRLDRCAAVIDASGATGHLLSGSESTAADAQVRVVATADGTLLVEVTDDVIVGPTARAGGDDHLEVWTAPKMPTWDEHCIEPASTAGVASWTVRVADGKVTPGFGKAAVTGLGVDRAKDASGAVRFRITLPPGTQGVTIAYADSDAAGKIERRIATSALAGGRLPTLGQLSPTSNHVACIVKDGALVPQLAPAKLETP